MANGDDDTANALIALAEAGDGARIADLCAEPAASEGRRLSPYPRPKRRLLERDFAALPLDAALRLNEALLARGVLAETLFERLHRALSTEAPRAPAAMRAAAWLLVARRDWPALARLSGSAEMAQALPGMTARARAEIADLALLGFYRRHRDLLGWRRRPGDAAGFAAAAEAELDAPVHQAGPERREARRAFVAYCLGDDAALARIEAAALPPLRLNGPISGLETVLSPERIASGAAEAEAAFARRSRSQVVRSAMGGTVALVSVDETYARLYAAGFLRSAAATGVAVHLHCVNFEPRAVLGASLDHPGIGWTVEEIALDDLTEDARRGYYAAARFIHLPTHLAPGRKILACDVDGVLEGSVEAAAPPGRDLALLFGMHPDRASPRPAPWDAIWAGAAVFADTDSARAFAEATALYLKTALRLSALEGRQLFSADQSALRHAWAAVGRRRDPRRAFSRSPSNGMRSIWKRASAPIR